MINYYRDVLSWYLGQIILQIIREKSNNMVLRGGAFTFQVLKHPVPVSRAC